MRVILPSRHAGDDADPQRALVTGVHHAVERVLDDEPVVEGVDDAVVVGAPALARVAVGVARQVLVARGLAAEDVVPDDAVVGVEAVEHVDAAVLVRVEERFAQLADLVLVHRGTELARVEILEQLDDLAVVDLGHEARRQRHSGTVVGDDVARVLHDEPVVEGVDRCGRCTRRRRWRPLPLRRAPRGCSSRLDSWPVTLNHIVISGA